jgi:hypothetical protein
LALHAHGQEQWLKVSAVPIVDSENRVQFVINIFHDVTEEERTERWLNAQYTTARIFANAATLAAAAPQFLQAVCESFGWELGLLWIVDRAADVLRCAEY